MIGYGNSLLSSALLATQLAANRERIEKGMDYLQPTLRSLFKNLPVICSKGDLRQRISSLLTDSRRVGSGSLFFALKGLRTNGNFYINEAIYRGAVGIVSDEPAPRSFDKGKATYIQVPDAHIALARVAARFYDHPDQALKVTGITGTNGKTTVATLTQFLLNQAQYKTGLLGTIHYDLGGRTLPAFRTTPESVDVYGLLNQMRLSDCSHAVMETSSHGINQKRVYGLHLDVAVFLNLTQDHIDYHKSMEAYFEVKTRIFNEKNGSLPRAAVVNIDDPYGRRLLECIPSEVQVITFGENPDADIHATELKLGEKGTEFTLHWPGGEQRVVLKLLGSYNVSNALAAMAVCYANQCEIDLLLPSLMQFGGVPGRMERVETGQPFNVIVDYAHTHEALNNALNMLRSITTGRLLVVFGCGGNRDRSKRALMTRAVLRYADRVWATADNPRSESISQIFEDMREGLEGQLENVYFINDRRRAIGRAISAARPGDCVFIAGKGHETVQELGNTVIPFDDRLVAREFLNRPPL